MKPRSTDSIPRRTAETFSTRPTVFWHFCIRLTYTSTRNASGSSTAIVLAENAPRTPGNAVQDFDNEMVQLQGGLFGDPDFDILAIRAGRNFGLPSPGHTTLTRLGPPGSDFQVDSFFDIFYEIDFQGAPGSILEGFSGTTQDTVRIYTSRVPEPSSIALMGIALLGLLAYACRTPRGRR